jgi:hypothetical protein
MGMKGVPDTKPNLLTDRRWQNQSQPQPQPQDITEPIAWWYN